MIPLFVLILFAHVIPQAYAERAQEEKKAAANAQAN
jgi:hypothetical protein